MHKHIKLEMPDSIKPRSVIDRGRWRRDKFRGLVDKLIAMNIFDVSELKSDQVTIIADLRLKTNPEIFLRLILFYRDDKSTIDLYWRRQVVEPTHSNTVIEFEEVLEKITDPDTQEKLLFNLQLFG